MDMAVHTCNMGPVIMWENKEFKAVLSYRENSRKV